MVLGLKVKAVHLADVAQGLVVLLAAGLQIGIGHIGQGQQSGVQLIVQHLQVLLIVGDGFLDGHRLCHVFGDLGFDGGGIFAALLGALLHAEQLAVFLGQLVLLCSLGFGGGLQTPDLHVQFQNAVDDGVAVHFLCLKTGLDCIGIFLDLANV